MILGCATEAGPVFSDNVPPAASAVVPVRPSLDLVNAPSPVGALALDLVYERDPRQAGPRMMELRLQIQGDLQYVRSERLAGALNADKDLVVQSEAPGRLRTLLYTTRNTTRLAPGPLVRFWFARTGPGEVRFVEQSPVFAPPETDVGVTFGAPVLIGGAL